MRVEFIATEIGFEDGLGGASNSKGTADYHYVLFGRDADSNGVYFEFDDQIHGAVDCVLEIVIGDGLVEFELKDDNQIIVTRGTNQLDWEGFLKGIKDVFNSEIISKPF